MEQIYNTTMSNLHQDLGNVIESKKYKNKAINNHYKQRAIENEVTDVKSLLNELYYRFKSNPMLGGEPESSVIIQLLAPKPPVFPGILNPEELISKKLTNQKFNIPESFKKVFRGQE